MRKYSRSDLYRYYGNTSFKTFLRAWFTPGYRYTFFLRIAQRKRGMAGLIAKLYLRKYSFKYGLQIPYRTTIGEGFYIGHFGNIVVSPQAVIGKNFNISQGVTIGRSSKGRAIGAPVIGDQVWVGANAVVVGGIHIGSHVLIAPGAYVNFDVPDHSLVIGNPGIIKSKPDPTEGYVNRIV